MPLPYQLGEILKEHLEAGAWEPGSLFPSERELQEHFKVSRSVVLPALNMLVDDGEIRRSQGAGTFVAPPKVRVPLCGLLGALLDGPRGQLVVSVVTITQHRHDSKVAGLLELGSGRSELTQVTSILSAGEPLCLIDSYVPLRVFPRFPVLVKAMKEGKESPPPPSLRLGKLSSSVENSRLGHWSSSLLGVKAGGPALVASVVQHGVSGRAKRSRPLEFARLIYRGDRVRLEAEAD